MKKRSKQTPQTKFSADVGRALKRSAQRARRVARMYGTPIYVMQNGKIVALKP
jgi:hypothetical protein